jgi:glycine/D-amino acid oxidase-like deaminating enzyme
MKHTHDIVILGGGAAGLSVAAGCAGLGLKTALVEKKALGGDCLYHGCVPSKTLLKTARVRSEWRRAAFYGLPEAALPPVDMGEINRRVWKLMDIASPIYPYPTMSELHRRAASGELAKKLFNPKVRAILRFLFGYRGSPPEGVE